ncbi:MAG: glycosyltransferase [Chloroflexi bacterium]|nr:glycosyltransferase [Chloroflexota bacterium]
MRVALVHDWLNQVGGAENVLEELHQLFPDAPIFTSMYRPEAMPEAYRRWDIRTSWLDRIRWSKTHHQWFLLAYPFAFRSLDLSAYDVVISNKSAFCINVRVRDDARHLCYCLTPTRFVWNFASYVRGEEAGGLARRTVPPFLPYLRSVEYHAAQRVAAFAAISKAVQQRVERYYRRPSNLIYPPVDVERFAPSREPVEDFFLVVSRLIPYKRIDIVVEAFNRLGWRLIVIGDGRERAKLEAMAGQNIRFLGRLDNAQTDEYRRHCRAFIFPGEDDFGIAPVEAMAAGRPVIAYAAGGALDTVVEGVTGTFFHAPTADALVEAMGRFQRMDFDPSLIQSHASAFSRATFRARLGEFVRTNSGFTAA